MFFDSNIRKYENVISYFDNKDIYPTVRIILDNTYALGIVITKWNNESDPNKGKFIAIKTVSDFYDSWDKLNMESIYSTIDNSLNEILDYTQDDIQYSPHNDIFVFKFSVNCWRNVILKKVKWIYNGNKPSVNPIEFLCN